MNKEKLSKALAKELWKQPSMTKLDMEFVIKRKLTEIFSKKDDTANITPSSSTSS